MDSFLLRQLEKHSRQRLNAAAFCLLAGKEILTFGRLQQAVTTLADQIRRVVPPGGVLMVGGPNQLELPVAILAGLSAQVRFFPVSHLLSADELRDLALRSGALACLGTPHVNDSLHPITPFTAPLEEVLHGTPRFVRQIHDGSPRPQPQQAIPNPQCELLLTSSGTTAKPKIVRRSLPSLDAVARNCAAATALSENDGVLAAIPLTHSYGLEHGLLAPIAAGACVHLCDGFDLPNVVEELSRGQINVFPGVPFMFEALSQLDEHDLGPNTFSSLRCAYSAGGPITASIMHNLESKGGLHLGQLYGATEIGSVTFRPPEPHDPQESLDTPGLPDPTNVGFPMNGVSIRILEPDPVEETVGLRPTAEQPVAVGGVGHVAVRAPSMLTGYVGEPDGLTADGFFLTGDLGSLDPHGCLHLTGRIKLLIDVGGRKVNPLEVEQVLAQHPDVSQCVVVPLPVTPTVSRLKAVVVTRNPQGQKLIDALRTHLQKRLAAYKVPRVIELCDALPRLPSGKIDRKACV